MKHTQQEADNGTEDIQYGDIQQTQCKELLSESYLRTFSVLDVPQNSALQSLPHVNDGFTLPLASRAKSTLGGQAWLIPLTHIYKI